jgi:hypothetical protein
VLFSNIYTLGLPANEILVLLGQLTLEEERGGGGFCFMPRLCPLPPPRTVTLWRKIFANLHSEAIQRHARHEIKYQHVAHLEGAKIKLECM